MVEVWLRGRASMYEFNPPHQKRKESHSNPACCYPLVASYNSYPAVAVPEAGGMDIQLAGHRKAEPCLKQGLWQNYLSAI